MTETARKKRNERMAEPTANNRPLVLAGALLALLAVTLVYPSLAWPLHGFLAGGGFLAILLLSVATLRRQPVTMDSWALLSIALLAIWGIYRAVGGWLAPYLPPATGLAVTSLLAAIVYTCGVILSRCDPVGVPRMVAGALLLATVTMSLHAFWQVHGPAGLPGTFRSMEASLLANMAADEPMREGLLHAVREGRASSTLGAPNIFGSLCVVGILLGTAVLFGASGRFRIIGAVAMLLCGGALVLSGSRGGVVATLGGMGILAALLAAWRWGGTRVYQGVAIGLSALTLVVVLVLVALFSLDTPSSRWMGSSGLGQRMYYWQTAFAAWADAPWFGHGTGSYGITYLLYRQPGSNETQHSHSWFFDSLAEGGLFGTLLLLVFLAVVAIRATALIHRAAISREMSRLHFSLCTGLVAAGLAVWIHGLAEYTMAYRETALVAFLALGVGTGSLVPPRTWRIIAEGKSFLVVTIFGVFLLAFSAYWLRTDWRIQGAGEIRRVAISLWGDPSQREEISRLLNQSIRQAPEDAAGWETRGMFRQGRGDGRALSDFEEAAERNPRSARLQERLSIYHEGRGTIDQAIYFQRRAVQLHPLAVSHRVRLAELLLESGEFDEAEEVWLATLGMHMPSASVLENWERVGLSLGYEQQLIEE
ncbi:MAG: O-antigen ligase family protein [Candidatus Sumerlaeia bacterium]|nr:O-antigen ligase family protein [Candidatus Sumerlaeia bacterium]